MNLKIIKLGLSNFRSIIANNIYLKLGFDFTYPIHVYVQINSQCNSKCKMCKIWREDKRELPAAIWINALKEIRPHIGNLKVSFTGGEVLLKKDIFETFEACNKENILFGMTTNGILLNKTNIKRFLDLNPFNVNISLDTFNPETYFNIRGVHCLEKVLANIEYLVEYRKKINSNILINLKTMVCKENLHELDKIAEYAREKNFVGVTYQPLIKETRELETNDESEEMFHIDKKALFHMIDKLIEMKRKGYDILNSEVNMRRWPDYFDGKIVIDRTNPCLVSLRNLYIFPEGDVQLCDYIHAKVGNIADDNLRSILNSERTAKLKKELVCCKRSCVYCVQRTIKDYITLLSKF
ncbi:MAG TPA: radical SAM protein [Nitrospirae bacterium]|nr:antilisterial bacteriocin subtilosin biosynthesis protein AlbA [bacterium BMS3Abin06]HDH12407.1 radical SAM protein [Nitrospirota bacterium]HDY99847.1 radical SAM protein [Nitrospirota bacterium]